jgi:hypothetical protein
MENSRNKALILMKENPENFSIFSKIFIFNKINFSKL